MGAIKYQPMWMVYYCFTNILCCWLLMATEAMAFVPGDSVEDGPVADARAWLPPRRPSLAWTNGDEPRDCQHAEHAAAGKFTMISDKSQPDLVPIFRFPQVSYHLCWRSFGGMELLSSFWGLQYLRQQRDHVLVLASKTTCRKIPFGNRAILPANGDPHSS